MRKNDSKFAAFLDDKFIPLDNKIKIGILVALILVPIVAFYFIYFSPKSKQLTGLENQKNKLIREIQNLREKERNKPILLKEVEKVEQEFEEAQISGLPPSAEQLW